MNLLSHFPDMTLTSDQRNALDQLSNFLNSDDRIFILQGYAGTGKTTLLKGFVKYLSSIKKQYQLMAPTGRAAKVINQKTGVIATTIHKGIYSFDELHEIEKSTSENDVSFLYQYKLRNNPEARHSIFLVDESSMVSDMLSQGEFFRFGSGRLLEDLIAYSSVHDKSATSKIIFIGDSAQLPPVGMNFSPALSENYLIEKYNLKVAGTEMTEVKRQDADNGVLHAATKIRHGLKSGYFNDFDVSANEKDIFNPKYADFLESYKSCANSKIIICYQNKTALSLNKVIRKDKFGNDLPIQKTDIIIIGVNNYTHGVMNGKFAMVSEASNEVVSRDIRFYSENGKKLSVTLTWRSVSLIVPDGKNQPRIIGGYILENFLYGDNHLTPEEQRALYVDFKMRHPKLKKGTEEFKNAISEDVYFNCLQLKYGYAVTCHKAQGGEWSNAFVFWDRGVKAKFNFLNNMQDSIGKTNSDFYRWAYTAVTRASENLHCINPPKFTSFLNLEFVDIAVQDAFNNYTNQSDDEIVIDINEVISHLKKFQLIDVPLTIQNHFIGRWFNLSKHYIDIESVQKVGYEIRYVFKRENDRASFMYWINGKNVFRENFQKIPNQTNSNEFFDEIVSILSDMPQVFINRDNDEDILKKVQFDYTFEEEKPFLNVLYSQLEIGLDKDISITKVAHHDYRERYTFEANGQICVIDFEYNNAGFFGRALPLESKCNSAALLGKLKNVINQLKTRAHVI
jgi:DNA-directed RNA polymerase subunit F